jgi:hypothetical protein
MSEIQSMMVGVDLNKYSEYILTVTIKRDARNTRRKRIFTDYSKACIFMKEWLAAGVHKVSIEGVLKTGGTELLIGR